MKFVEKSIRVICIMLIIFACSIIFNLTNKVFAGNESAKAVQSNVVITNSSAVTTDVSKMSIGVNSKYYWRIISGDSAYTDFCIRGGGRLHTWYTSFSKSNIFTIASIPTYFKSSANYNSAMWLIDNAYIPSVSDSLKAQLKTNLKSILNSSDAKTAVDQLSDNEIVAIEACIFWRFSINVNKFDDSASVVVAGNQAKTNLAQALFNELYTIANQNYNTYKHTNITDVNISKSSSFSINTETGNAGPFSSNVSVAASDIDVYVNGTQLSANDFTVSGNKSSWYIENLGDDLNKTSGATNEIKVTYKKIITKAYLLTSSGLQNLITMTKYIATANASGKDNVPIPELDLALVKTIVSYTDADGKVVKVDRFNPETDVSTTGLDNGNSTDATYKVSKGAIKVTPGATITYRIYVFNEGEVDAIAKIEDYLPSGLTIAAKSKGDWTVNEHNIATSINTKTIKAYSKENISYLYKDITCKVDENVDANKILVNYAEVVAWSCSDSAVTKDRDSAANNMNVENYRTTVNNLYGSSYVKSEYNQQDDDDFERIVIIKPGFDLALRQYISAINDETVPNREPLLYGKEEVSSDTFIKFLQSGSSTYEYYHQKNTLEVNRGDYITFTLRVYNECLMDDYDGYAYKITDVIPAGLTFDEEKTLEANNATWIDTQRLFAVSNSDGTTTVNIFAKKGTKYALANVMKYYASIVMGKESAYYQEVKLVCKVDDNATSNTRFLNVAQIAQYCYVNSNNECIIVEPNDEGIVLDRDSTIGDMDTNGTDNSTTIYEAAAEKLMDYSPEFEQYVPGLQDDDDFESITVKEPDKTKYNFNVRKFLYTGPSSYLNIGTKIISGVRIKYDNNETQAITNTDGIATLYEEKDIEEDWYLNGTIVETVINEVSSADDIYIPIKGPIYAYYTFKIENEVVTVDEAKLSSVRIENITKEQFENLDNMISVELQDNSSTKLYVMIKVKSADNTITIEIPNSLVTGSYELQILKVDEENESLEGAEFGVEGDLKQVTTQNTQALTTDENGKIDLSCELENTGWSYDTITETDIRNIVSDKAYVQLEDSINIYKCVENVDYKYTVTKIGFGTEDGEYIDLEDLTGSAELKKEVLLEDGSTVDVTLVVNKTLDVVSIKLVIPNNPIKYKVQLLKVDQDNNPLSDVTFKVNDILTTPTDENGLVELEETCVSATGKDLYTVSEINVDSKYYKLAESLNFYVSVSNEKEIRASFNEKLLIKTKQVTLTNGEKATAVLEVIDDGLSIPIVQITIPNEEKKVDYDFLIQKIDSYSGEELTESVTFGVQQIDSDMTIESYTVIEEQNIISSSQVPVIGNGILDEKQNVELGTTYRYRITEDIVPDSYVKTLTKDVIVTVNVNEDGIVSAKIERYNGVSWAQGHTEKYLDLKIDGTAITLVVSNLRKVEYNFNLIKVDELGEQIKSDANYEGAKFDVEFNVYGSQGNSEETLEDIIVNGKYSVNKENVVAGNTMTAKITEKNSKQGYTNLLEGKYILVSYYIDADTRKLCLQSSGNTNFTLYDAETEQAIAYDDATELYNSITVIANNNGLIPEITVQVPNKKIEGNYSLQIIKIGEDDSTFLNNVDFTVNEQKYTTNSEGIATVINQGEITVDTVDVKDCYTISEIDLKDNKYIPLESALSVYVTKGIVDETYAGTGISFTENGETKTSISTTATLKDGASVTVIAKIENGIVKVIIPNNKITGEYTIQIKKVNKENPSEVVGGVEFNVFDPAQLLIPVVTDATTGIGVIEENRPITSEGTNLYKITESFAPNGYRKISHHSIIARVNLGISEDGTSYIPTGVVLSLTALNSGAEAEAEEIMLNEGLSYDITNNVITIIIPNQPTTDYKLKVQKVDADDNSQFLDGAIFTVDGPEGNILDNENIEDGVFVQTVENVNTNSEYSYQIRENSAPEGYQNILEDMYLDLNIVLDVEGNIDQTNSYIDVKCEDTNLSLTETIQKVREATNYIKDLSYDTTDNTIIVTIENPKITKDYSLSLFKHELNSTQEVANANFTLKQSTDNGTTYNTTINTFTTPIASALTNVEGAIAGTTYYYELEETAVPNNYVSEFSNIRFNVNVSIDGTVSANINKIYDGTNWVDYSSTTHGDYVSIQVGTNNNIEISWANSVEYTFTVLKKEYPGTGELSAAGAFTGNATFKIERVSPTAEVIYEGTLTNAQYVFAEDAVNSNSTYKYRITETATDVGYSNLIVNVPIIVTIRTDSTGNIIPTGSVTTGSSWKPENTVGLSTATLMSLSNMFDMDIQDNQVTFYVGNYYDNYYQVQLVKVDQYGEIKEDATFSVIMPDGNYFDADTSTTLIDNPITNANGVISLGYRDISANTVETYQITEVVPPVGYNMLEGKLTLNVDLTGATTVSDLTASDVSVVYTDATNTVTTLTGLSTEIVWQGNVPTIRVIIPNEGKQHSFKLIKTDTENNNIVAEELNNGNYDGAYFSVVRRLASGDNIVTGTIVEESILSNDVLENGIFEEKVGSYINGSYVYTITENKAKTGFKNILDGYVVQVTVNTDLNGDVIATDAVTNPTSYKIINPHTNVEYTSLFTDYVSLEIGTDDNGESVVTLKIKNPSEYKLRLNKLQASGSELSTAVLEAVEVENGTDGTSYTMQNVSTLLTDSRIIGANEVQTWKVYELSNVHPYINMLGENYILITVQNTDAGVVINNYKIMTPEGTELPNTDIAYAYINVEMAKENGIDVVNVVIENPTQYNLSLTKYDTALNEITCANLKIVEGNNEYTNEGTSSILVSENNIDIGDIKVYTITEESVTAPYINLLEGKEIKLWVRMKSDAKLSIELFDVVDAETGESVSKTDIAYMYLTYGIVENNGVETIQIKIENPFEYNFNLIKKDTNQNNLAGAQLRIEKAGKLYTNLLLANRAIEEKNVDIGTITTYKITEKSTPAPHVNILENKYVLMNVLMKNTGIPEVTSFEIYNSQTNELVENSDIAYAYLTYNVTETNGINTVNVVIENPVEFDLEIHKTDTNGNELQGPNINIKKGAIAEYNTEGNPNYTINEPTVDIGDELSYIITETATVAPYVNILEGKYIKLKVHVKQDESLEITEFNIYNTEDNSLIPTENEIYEYVSADIIQSKVRVFVQNPITFKVEVEKVDSDGQTLEGAEFTIDSTIVSEQNASYSDTVEKEGVTDISNDGTITGTTTADGIISYDETWVSEGIYEYEIKEIASPGNQYVNVLEGYKIYVRVKVSAEGTLKIVDKQGAERTVFYIETLDGEAAPRGLYRYVSIGIENNVLKASIKVDVENPVRYNINVHKTLAGSENDTPLEDVYLTSVSDFSGKHELITNVYGNDSYEETAVDAGKYSYIFTETETAGEGFINILEGYYIKVNVQVAANGELTILNSEGAAEDGKYYIYEQIEGTSNYKLVDPETTKIDDYISVNVTSSNDVYSLNVNIENPQEYIIQINKLDKDTNERMNDVEFEMTVTDSENNIVELKSSKNLGETIDTSAIITSNYDGQDGVIRIENILIEEEGTYYINLVEDEDETYQDIGNVKIKYEIVETNGKYTITNVEVLSGNYYVQSAIATAEAMQRLIMDIQNEKISGSYNLEIIKTNEEEEPLENIGFNINDEETDRKTNANGKISCSTELTGTGWECDTITETDSQNATDGNDYVKVDEITIYRYTEVVDNKYVVTKIGFSDEEGYYIDVPTTGTASTTWAVKTEDLSKKVTVTLTVSAAENGIVSCSLNIENPKVKGEYEIKIKKVDQDLNPIEGVTFKVNGESKGPTGTDGILDLGTVPITAAGTDTYVISEINVNGSLLKLAEDVTVKVMKIRTNGQYMAVRAYFDNTQAFTTKTALLEDGKTEVTLSASVTNGVVTITIPNKKVKFDLALQKFITGVNNTVITEREPEFSITEDGKYVYTPKYENMLPVTVANTDIVTYTLRVYNEGEGDCYAAEIMDDIPEGLEFVPYVEGDNSINDTYNWIMYREVEDGETPTEALTRTYNGKTYVVTDDVTKSDFIRTEYLSKESGEDRMDATSTINPNLLKAFYSNEMETPNYRDVKVQFKVKYEVTSIEDTSRVIVNYAQITDNTDKNGEDITDIDSEPNVWTEGEDDQDKEKIKVKYFDLALKKWVSEAVVIENGTETVYEGNKETDIPEPALKVDLAKSKIDDVVVKFKYQIKITNEGEIAGYAKEVSDYIPEGLKFVAADNTEFDWKEVDGKVVTDYLAGTLLQPDESATVTIVLTWINSEDNLGLKVNVAEISKDYNDQGDTSDVDSTPNNQVEGEDDIDDAPVILAIKTGDTTIAIYAGIALAVITILASGAILIKKYVV